MDSVKHIAVIGAGIMGSGIATICLQYGFQVKLYDPDEKALEKAKVRCLKRSEANLVDNLSLTSNLESAVSKVDFVIEAIPEKIDLKRQVFTQIDSLSPPHAILATNTSELSVTAIAGATKRPAQVVGMHWFNPPERMKLVEIVQAIHTSEQTLALTEAVAKTCLKTTVVVKDRQGFVTTRALSSLLIEAIRMLEEDVASLEAIDTAVKLGLNHPMGPLELADYIGLDTMLFIADSMTNAYGERFRPPQTLQKLVEAGKLGRKSGQGFYTYE